MFRKHLTAALLTTSLAMAPLLAAAPAQAAHTSSSSSFTAAIPTRVGTVKALANTASSTTPQPQVPQEARGAASALLKAFAAGVKKVPGLWNVFISGVKKAYTWFANNTWKAVKAIAAAISFLLNALDVWQGFH